MLYILKGCASSIHRDGGRLGGEAQVRSLPSSENHSILISILSAIMQKCHAFHETFSHFISPSLLCLYRLTRQKINKWDLLSWRLKAMSAGGVNLKRWLRVVFVQSMWLVKFFMTRKMLNWNKMIQSNYFQAFLNWSRLPHPVDSGCMHKEHRGSVFTRSPLPSFLFSRVADRWGLRTTTARSSRLPPTKPATRKMRDRGEGKKGEIEKKKFIYF